MLLLMADQRFSVSYGDGKELCSWSPRPGSLRSASSNRSFGSSGKDVCRRFWDVSLCLTKDWTETLIELEPRLR